MEEGRKGGREEGKEEVSQVHDGRGENLRENKKNKVVEVQSPCVL